MLKRDSIPFNCSNNVITIGINIIVICFMLKCDTHVVTCHSKVTSFFPFLFTTADMFAIFKTVDVT